MCLKDKPKNRIKPKGFSKKLYSICHILIFMSQVFTRKIQRQGTSIVVPLPAELRRLGYNQGVTVDLWEDKGQIIIARRPDEEMLCHHCDGLRTCRCPDCAYAAGTIVRRPVLIAVKCSYCNGKGIINPKHKRR